jgi:D-ribose pyranase
VFEAVWAELAVESVTFADESKQHNPSIVALAERLAQQGVGVETISHADFKQRCTQACAIVRTGETAPYANVILHAGVTF